MLGLVKNRIKKIIIILIILLIPTLVSVAMDVNVDVLGTIGGNIAYFSSFDVVNNTPQKFLMDWENTGSVSCRARMRVDIYNETEPKPVYTAWSGEVRLEPGDHSDLRAYYYPTTGNFTAKILMQYCNSVHEISTMKFEAFGKESNTINLQNTNSGQDGNDTQNGLNHTKSDYDKMAFKSQDLPFEITRTKSTKDYVEIGVKAKRNITNLIAMPEEYPLGWIFESGSSNRINKDEEKTIRINYVPTIWKNKTIDFNLAEDEGNGRVTVPITLNPKEETRTLTFEQRMIAVSMIINLVLLILLVKNKNG